jgi:hypothetical protein
MVWHLAISFLAFIAFSVPIEARAGTNSEPPAWLEVKIPIEVQNDYDYASTTSGNERNNLGLTVEPEATVNILPVPGLSIYAHGVVEQVVDAAPNEDRYFKDQGFYIEDLFLSFERDRFAFRGGKMNPGFGIAWDQAPGIYGTDMAEEYELAERIALTASVKGDAGSWGKHTLTAGTFFLDTSPLHHSIYSTSRGTLGRSDGGVSNTEDFSSFNITIDGGEFSEAPDLTYHLGFVYQANGTDALQNELGYAAAISNRFDLGGEMTLTPLLEVVRLDDFEGTRDKRRTYWTLSFLGEWKSWNAALAATHRRTQQPGLETAADYQYQASLGYAFDVGLTADVGWKRLKEAGSITDRIGLFFTYEFGFRR